MFAIFAAAGSTAPIATVQAAGQTNPVQSITSEPDLDLTSITLYRSGVGYFEFRGKVAGHTSVSLGFEEAHVNDVLKSLVALDFSGGSVHAAGYDSGEPLNRRLASFAVDLSDNPSLAKVLARLRGEQIRIFRNDDAPTVRGVVLSVDTPPSNRREAPDSSDTPAPTINLLSTGQGILAVPLASVERFELADEELYAEMARALEAIATANATDGRTIDLSFKGEGDRDVLVGYVHETPVWKTSYRLVLDEATGSTPPRGAHLQGWAIVENTTDDDWTDVRLSLVAGRPVSFVMDLASPLYLTRPTVAVPVEVAAAPRSYGAETGKARAIALEYAQPAARDLSAVPTRLDAPASATRGRGGSSAARYEFSMDAMTSESSGIGGDEPGGARATGEEVGEVFRYTLDVPVTVERRRAAMLPIISEPITAARVSIFDPAAGLSHPMRGVRITNTSDLKLMPGPIAVFDAGAFAGDASIRHLAAGDTRLLSYAVDLDVTVSSTLNTESSLRSVRISRGVFTRTNGRVRERVFSVTNADQSRPRTVIIEVLKQPGWDLDTPSEPASTTDRTERFELTVPPGKTRDLRLVRSRTDSSTVTLSSANINQLRSLSRSGDLPDAILNAIQRVQAQQDAVRSAERAVNRLITERREITDEQTRLRGNMQAIDRTSDLYARYLTKLDEQESRLETISSDLDAARAKQASATAALERLIASLDVG